jgi:hypothetical protein
MVAKKLISVFSLIFCTIWCSAQSIIKGTVTDSKTGEALIGATVVVKGTTEGAATDVNGNFSFTTSQNPPLTLVTSFVGYVNKETVVTDFSKEIKIKIGQNEVVLKDVTITGSRISEKIKLKRLITLLLKKRPQQIFTRGWASLKVLILPVPALVLK